MQQNLQSIAIAVQANVYNKYASGSIDKKLYILFLSVIDCVLRSPVHVTVLRAGEFVNQFNRLVSDFTSEAPCSHHNVFLLQSSVNELQFLLHCVQETFTRTGLAVGDVELYDRVASWIEDVIRARQQPITSLT
jgi:hypothetical protein